MTKDEACKDSSISSTSTENDSYEGVAITGFSTPVSKGLIKRGNTLYYLIESFDKSFLEKYENGTRYDFYMYNCTTKKSSQVLKPSIFLFIAKKLWIAPHAWYVGDSYYLKDNNLRLTFKYTNYNLNAKDAGENEIVVTINLAQKKATYLSKEDKKISFQY